MQIYFFGLHLPKLPSYLFICAFIHFPWCVLGKKKKLGHRKKTASSLVCHTDFPYCAFLLFLFTEKEKREHLCQSVPEPSPSSVSLTEIVLFRPFFFGARGTPVASVWKTITRKRAGLVLLDGDAASHVRNLDDKYPRRHRAEDYHYCSSARPFSVLLCFHFLSSFCCQLKKNPAKENVQPNLEFLFESNGAKVVATQTWDACKRQRRPFTPQPRMAANAPRTVWLAVKRLKWRNG